MPRPTFPKTLPEFQSQFSTEEACEKYLASCRWPDGFVCPRCGNQSAYELEKLKRWQCTGCRHQVSVTAPQCQNAFGKAFRQDPGKHAAGTNVSRKSLRWDWRLEANLNRKANGLASEGPFCGTLCTFVGLTHREDNPSTPPFVC